jgi:hypothetical protein
MPTYAATVRDHATYFSMFRLAFVFLSWLCRRNFSPIKPHVHVTKYRQATCVFEHVVVFC